MTSVRFFPAEFRMEISGHAGSGKPGEDLCCAAASALTFALANAARDEDSYHAQVLIDPENAAVRVQCEPEEPALCEEMFRVILHGLVVLKMRYPGHVKITIEDKPSVSGADSSPCTGEPIRKGD